jgi:hypothetical protein
MARSLGERPQRYSTAQGRFSAQAHPDAAPTASPDAAPEGVPAVVIVAQRPPWPQ